MITWRLLKTDNWGDGFWKMSVDEAILKSVVEKKSLPTLRFYTCPNPAVAIGYFQSVEKVVNLENCQKDNIQIFRRMTGGGSVFKEASGELNYALIIPEDFSKSLVDILTSYQMISRGLIEGLKILGLEVEFAGINDLIIDNQKISGNAQTRTGRVILQHGTIILNFDSEKMMNYLKIPKIKLIKGQKVGSLQDYLPNLNHQKLEEILIKGFQQVFKVNFILKDLTPLEKKVAQDLYRNKYSQTAWIFQR